ncbi:MAG: hypothetical protein ICV68_09430 [Pyrinomonadaceae bacterium]|nr:hypothetical protein [Pyrinomonadaceae bacterium]
MLRITPSTTIGPAYLGSHSPTEIIALRLQPKRRVGQQRLQRKAAGICQG